MYQVVLDVYTYLNYFEISEIYRTYLYDYLAKIDI